MPPKKKAAPTNSKNEKEKAQQKRESVAQSEGKEESGTPNSDESRSVDEYSDLGAGGGGSRRGSRFDQKKGQFQSGVDDEVQELQDMKDRLQKLERTTTVLNKHDLVVQKLIMKAREDLVNISPTYTHTHTRIQITPHTKFSMIDLDHFL